MGPQPRSSVWPDLRACSLNLATERRPGTQEFAKVGSSPDPLFLALGRSPVPMPPALFISSPETGSLHRQADI